MICALFEALIPKHAVCRSKNCFGCTRALAISWFCWSCKLVDMNFTTIIYYVSSYEETEKFLWNPSLNIFDECHMQFIGTSVVKFLMKFQMQKCKLILLSWQGNWGSSLRQESFNSTCHLSLICTMSVWRQISCAGWITFYWRWLQGIFPGPVLTASCDKLASKETEKMRIVWVFAILVNILEC